MRGCDKMMKKNKIFFITIFSIVMIFLLTSCVHAALTWDDIKKEYKNNRNIVNELSDEEFEEWKKVISKKGVEVDAVTGVSTYPQDEIDLLGDLEDAVKERERKNNSDSIKDKSEEEIEEMKDYSPSEIISYLEKSNPDDFENIPDDLMDAWEETMKTEGNEATQKRFENLLSGATVGEINDEADDKRKGYVLYTKPELSDSGNGSESLEDMMNDGDDFIRSASDSPIKLDELQSTSSNLYNIFVEVGVALAVLIGLVIGIKYMYSSVDSKAEIKKLLVPYLVGCVVIFGALGIWKLMVNIMESF